MERQFDTIVWGPSLNGIIEAIERKEAGQRVLLAGKFGFPGGKATEALASFFPIDYFTQNPLTVEFLQRMEQLKTGVLHRTQDSVLFHPEAVKRVCWQLINDFDIEVLFHILPVRTKNSAGSSLEFFGREGSILLKTQELVDKSDDKFFSGIYKEQGKVKMILNAFFTESLPEILQGFNVVRRFDTSIGQYLSVAIEDVAAEEIEKTFNRELDRLSKESWGKYGSRILMVPVYPEIGENAF
jgi:hypothetical protein